MTLHLVRLAVNHRALSTFAVAGGISDDDGGYAVHCALRQRFGTAGPQPFRFFPEHRRGPHVLGYTVDRAALDDALSLPIADPLLGGVFDAPDIQPMPETWREGARYAFETRVRPVVRYGARIRAERKERDDAWQKRAGEVDAFVAACERAGEGVPVDREAVYREWLAGRFGDAAALETAELRQLQRVRGRRRVHEKGAMPDRASSCDREPPQPRRSRTRIVEGPDALMAGTLTVRDPAAFAAMLARGIGRHAAFGFGMLLLSPPGRSG